MRKKDDEKEQRIKAAVIELFLKEGFDGASIAKIARLAEVSPATVYVYFDSKEDMLQDIYREYSDKVYRYLLQNVSAKMQGAQLIETLMRTYYSYMVEHSEVFSFVEQCSHCPTLSGCCSGQQGLCHLFDLIREMKARGVIRPYSDENLAALLFYPVKAIALDGRSSACEREARLEELVGMVQNTLLAE